MSEVDETAATSGEAQEKDLEAIQKLNEGYRKIRNELSKIIVGQDKVIEQLLIAMFARGHCLLVGVPGLAKTLMISTLAKAFSLTFHRIQFTPDLMPSDITGTEVIVEDKATGQRAFKFLKGPVFANVILADEINRTPPKTQAALLQSMQEQEVTVGGETYPLSDPFFVLATQNPIEQEGTYPLPEAQLDRFMFNVLVDYPEEEEEFEIMKLATSPMDQEIQQVLGGEDILALQEIVRRVPIADHVVRYAMAIPRLTRVHKGDMPDFVNQWVSWGAGPRAGICMILGGKARAMLNGRYYVSCEDIQEVAYPALRHRIITNFNAEAEGVTTDTIIEKLIALVPRADSEIEKDGRLPKIFGSEDSVSDNQP